MGGLISSGASAPLLAMLTLPPMPKVPATAKNLGAYFAIFPNATQDQQTLLQAAFDSLEEGDFLVVDGGPYRHSGVLIISVKGVTIWSNENSRAIFHSTNPAENSSAFSIQADNVSVYGIQTRAETTVRRQGSNAAGINIVATVGAPRRNGCIIRRCRVEEGPAQTNGSCGPGILIHNASNFLVAENYVSRTLADAIHITQGSYNGRVLYNKVHQPGDDMIAVVSYPASGGGVPSDAASISADLQNRLDDRRCHNILIAGNDVTEQYWGRGITVVGSRNITIRGNRIDKTTHGAAVLIARENGVSESLTFGVDNVLVEDNTITDCQTTTPSFVSGDKTGAESKTGHGALEMYQHYTAAELTFPNLVEVYEVKNILMRNNTIIRANSSGARVNIRSDSNSRLGLIGISNNTFRSVVSATPIQVQPTTGTTVGFNIYCPNNTDDGTAINVAGTAAPLPTVVGYNPQ